MRNSFLKLCSIFIKIILCSLSVDMLQTVLCIQSFGGKYLLNAPDSNPSANVKEWIQQNWKQCQQKHGGNGQNKIVPYSSTRDTELSLRRKGGVLLRVQVHTHQRHNQYNNQSNAINMNIFPASEQSYSIILVIEGTWKKFTTS